MKIVPKGSYVKHTQYGAGVVIQADAERTAIDFDDHGLKKFVTSLMVVELVDEAVAPRRKRGRKTPAKARVAAAGK